MIATKLNGEARNETMPLTPNGEARQVYYDTIVPALLRAGRQCDNLALNALRDGNTSEAITYARLADAFRNGRLEDIV